MMLTEVKCRAAESWLRDILLDTGSPPWELEPTPIPDLSPEQAKEVEGIYAQNVMQLIQMHGQAPSPTEMSEIREMVHQDYRFRILQAAQNRVSRMKLKIQDQFVQGGWPESFNDFITNFIFHEEIARFLFKLINKKGVINIGGKTQSVYKFAKKYNPTIKKISAKKPAPRKFHDPSIARGRNVHLSQ